MTTQFSFKDLTAKIPSLTHLIHWLAGSVANSLSHLIRSSIICQQNAIADNSLRSPLHHFSSHIPKSVASFSAKRIRSRVHLQKVHSGRLNPYDATPSVFKPSVCESRLI